MKDKDQMTSTPDIDLGLQHTLKSEIGCSGTGLHTGETVSILLKPAPTNTGVVFCRTDEIGNGAEIPALVENVVEATLCTTLGNKDGVTVATVEHLLAALAGCAIDNVYVEVSGSELPIMDGSAAPFVFLIECAGVVTQDAPRRFIEVLKRVDVEIDGREVSLSPGSGFSVGFSIEFDSDAIGKQDMNVRLVNGTFKGEISRARTFGFAEEVDQLRRMASPSAEASTMLWWLAVMKSSTTRACATKTNSCVTRFLTVSAIFISPEPRFQAISRDIVRVTP